MRVELLATRAQFPRLPLASTESDTAICGELTVTGCGMGISFELSATFERHGRSLFAEKIVDDATADCAANGACNAGNEGEEGLVNLRPVGLL